MPLLSIPHNAFAWGDWGGGGEYNNYPPPGPGAYDSSYNAGTSRRLI
ncbi:MAG: hypothetical protein WB988_20060 [Candidatus Nitrosopolaris sp.]